MHNDRDIVYVNPKRILSIILLFFAGVFCYTYLSMGILAEVSPDFTRWLKTLGGLFIIHSLFMVVFDLQPESTLNIRSYIQLVIHGCYAILLIGLLGSVEMVPIVSLSRNGIEIITDTTYTNTPLRIIIYILLGSLSLSIMKYLKHIFSGGGMHIQES